MGIATRLCYMTTDDDLLPFKLHAGYVFVAALTVFVMRWEDLGSMFSGAQKEESINKADADAVLESAEMPNANGLEDAAQGETPPMVQVAPHASAKAEIEVEFPEPVKQQPFIISTPSTCAASEPSIASQMTSLQMTPLSCSSYEPSIASQVVPLSLEALEEGMGTNDLQDMD